MQETLKIIHLTTLLGKLRTHRVKKEVTFHREVVRRAALLALQDDFRGPVELEEYPDRLFWDKSKLPPELPPDSRQEVRDNFVAQEEMLNAVKDGKLNLVQLSPFGSDIDLRLMDQWEYLAINRKWNKALCTISREQYERQGYDDRTCLLWESIVQEIIKNIKVPCNETQLRSYADAACLNDVSQSNEFTNAIAELHDSGFTERWLRQIWDRHHDEAEEAELSKPTTDGRGIPGMTWKDAQKAAELHVKRHYNVFPGVNALAKIVGCAPATMSKAIKKSSYLNARYAEHKAKDRKAKEVPLAQEILESTPSQIDSQDMELTTLIAEQHADQAREANQHVKRQRSRTQPE